MDFKKMNLDQADGDIIFFGDSLVQAMIPYALGEKYVNMGVGGYKISQINSLIGISNIQKYKKVVIEGGVNDVLTQSSVDDIKRKYIDLLFGIKDKNIVLVKTLPVEEKASKNYNGANQKIDKINEAISQYCNSLPNCSIVDVPNEFKNKDVSNLYMDDGVHLKKDGYIYWTNKIKQHLN